MRTVTVALTVFFVLASPALAQSSSSAVVPSVRGGSIDDPRLVSDPAAHLLLRNALREAVPPGSHAMPHGPSRSAQRRGSAEGALLIRTLYQYWTSEQWEDGYRGLYTYNDDGTRAQLLEQRWNGTAWVNEYRIDYSYVDGNLSEEVSQYRQRGTWVNYTRLTYSYAEGHLMEWLEQFWSLTAWADYRRIQLTYGGGANYTEALVQDRDGSAWQDTTRYFFTYNAAGRFVEIREETWTGSDWANSYLDVYSYDEANRLAEVLTQGWDETGWLNDYRKVYTYTDGDLTEALAQDWDGTAWANTSRRTYTNDAEGNPVEEVEQFFEDATWVNDTRNLHEYESATAGEPGSSAPSTLLLSVYPNPTLGEATLVFALDQAGSVELAVYDLMGRRVAIQPSQGLGVGAHELRWDFGGLPAGTYLLQIRSEDTAVTRRLVVVK